MEVKLGNITECLEGEKLLPHVKERIIEKQRPCSSKGAGAGAYTDGAYLGNSKHSRARGSGTGGDAFGGRKMRRVFLLLRLQIYRDPL